MSSICYYLCCCGCCRGSDSYVRQQMKNKKHQTLSNLEQIKATSDSDAVWAVTKNPLEVKTKEMTETFELPNRQFKKDEDVLKSIGFKIGKQIDSGSFGVILSGCHLKMDLKIAIKKIVIPESLNIEKANKRDEIIKDVKHELYILQKIIHPHVIKLIRHLMIKRGRNVSLYILMQFAENGNLAKYCDRYGAIDEDKCKQWFAQMLSGLTYMHKQSIAHRDLKLSNILLDEANDVLIADFGLSRVCWRESKQDIIMSSTFCGTPPYMAPEVLKLEKQKYNRYNALIADVWSLGVILFRMYTGEYPFPNKLSKALKWMNKKKWKIPKSLKPSHQMIKLFKIMFEPKPEKRIRMEFIQRNAWIRDVFKIVEIKSLQKMKEKEQTFKLL